MLSVPSRPVGNEGSEGNTPKLKKQSGLSVGSKDKSPKKASANAENGKDSSLSPSGQTQLRERQLALLREVEMNWYLKLCNLSSERSTACTTGMPHRNLLKMANNAPWIVMDCYSGNTPL
ncbi:hypothetical protein mRhiFer1_007151 [Rhinolophus ferrumequinum]|uniref:Uncharacterized protein n=1 Tax=Rhinolophus ferrumequinum TaxID=59479 RepID=A0A7J8AET3_RHIFE|nr:hypothetical protein mRhiFer1_007151 [Rhinolophus ferrumequinum]